jgi:hypothetical protein
MIAFFMAPISYLHVLVVLACLFVLLQFARLGFCSRDCKSLVLGGGGGGCCFFLSSLYVVYCFLIRICRVPVPRLHLGLLVVFDWVLIWCFFLFTQGLQCWDVTSAIGSLVTFFCTSVCIEYY